MTLLARDRHGPEEDRSAGPASRQLLAEHEVILHVLAAIQSEADHIRQGFTMDENRVRQILDFSRSFTDRCHHGKEERYYFPAAQVYVGQRVYGFVDELEVEHAYGRSIMDEIDYLLGSGESEAAQRIADRLSVYATLMRRHVQKENERLYQRAGTFLPTAEEQALMIGFERIEEVELGLGFHERYHHLAEDLTSGLLGVR